MRSVIDHKDRIRHIVKSALDDTSFMSLEREAAASLVLKVRRSNGTGIGVRFLGVSESSSDVAPEPESRMVLRDVTGTGPLWTILIPILRKPSYSVRVRIEAGAARLEIVCEDVEWWEESPPG